MRDESTQIFSNVATHGGGSNARVVRVGAQHIRFVLPVAHHRSMIAVGRWDADVARITVAAGRIVLPRARPPVDALRPFLLDRHRADAPGSRRDDISPIPARGPLARMLDRVDVRLANPRSARTTAAQDDAPAPRLREAAVHSSGAHDIATAASRKELHSGHRDREVCYSSSLPIVNDLHRRASRGRAHRRSGITATAGVGG